MLTSRHRPKPRDLEASKLRRQQQAIDGAQAMGEYVRNTESVRERLARLRAERQSREAQAPPEKTA